MKLLIVESPAKCKTIKSYLGSEYEVMASYGHIRDLAKDKHFFGIDISNGFQPAFEISKEKYKYINALKESAKSASVIYLASDDDREGEAIAWHLAQVLKLDISTNPRICFTEITKDAVTSAIKKPTTIDMNKVHSQQARQVLDKLVGFELSPLLWKHISQGSNLSAGRVQSVVTRLIIDREDEIGKFVSQSYFKVAGSFSPEKEDSNLTLSAVIPDKISTEEEVYSLLSECLKAQYKVESIDIKDEKRKSRPPFITSTLQQEAGSRLGLSPKLTMSLAQKLYEKGKITYMRTDSTAMSGAFQKQVKEYISGTYGQNWLSLKQWGKKVKGSQEAHECIRPTRADEIALDSDFTPVEKKLYKIIWQRALASQMADQEVQVMHIGINILVPKPRKEIFISQFEKEIFPGWTILYKTNLNSAIDGSANADTEHGDALEDGDNNSCKVGNLEFDNILKRVQIGTVLKYVNIKAVQKYTEPISRYTEATLVKMLENKGIGRPSTYSSMVDKIQEKGYVKKVTIPGKELPVITFEIVANKSNIDRKTSQIKTPTENNKLVPTDMGRIVTAFLVENFGELMDYGFTSEMESELDNVSQGDLIWNEVVKRYYDSFHPKVLLLGEEKSKAKDKYRRLLGKHPVTGQDVYIMLAKNGPCLQAGDINKPKSCTYWSIDTTNTTSIDQITWEDALKVLAYPKDLGKIGDKSVEIKKGPYGYYLKWDNKNISIPKGQNVDNINLKVAEGIINGHLTSKSEWCLAQFDNLDTKDATPIQILKGKQFKNTKKPPTPYIKKGKINIPLKGKTDEEASKLSYEEVKQIIDNYTPTKSTYPTKFTDPTKNKVYPAKKKPIKEADVPKLGIPKKTPIIKKKPVQED